MKTATDPQTEAPPSTDLIMLGVPGQTYQMLDGTCYVADIDTGVISAQPVHLTALLTASCQLKASAGPA